MRELLTASRMNKLLDCPRAHYWSYEIGLKSDRPNDALRFGSAWHRAMECIANGGEYQAALEAAISDKEVMDEFVVATIAGLLTGYIERWRDDQTALGGCNCPMETIATEIEFSAPIKGSITFAAAGKIDRVVKLYPNGLGVMEHKTTSEGLDDASDYWLRLRANPQLLQYSLAVQDLYGYLPDAVIYDVVRKPSIAPLASVPDLDENGAKIVLAADGTRAMNSRTGAPKASADKEKGERMSSHAETPAEFAERLANDCRERPDFYFARREVPILTTDVEEFVANRLAIGRMILGYRQDEKIVSSPHMAWPKHLHGRVCQSCEYKSFCLQNLTPDLQHPPTGFVVGEIHSELATVTKGT